MDCIDLVQDWGRWRMLVNAAMNLRFYKMQGKSWPAEDLSDSQEGHSSTELVSMWDYSARWQNNLWNMNWGPGRGLVQLSSCNLPGGTD